MEIAQLKWLATNRARRLSWSSSAGLLMLFASLILLLAQSYPSYLKTRQLESANASLGGEHVQLQQQPQTQAEQMRRFYALLPTVQDIPAVLTTIAADARSQSVVLSEGQFKLTFDPDSSVGRYQMVLPVKAGYAATREFVRAALKDTPAMSLQELSFEREDPSSTVANARIQFVLYVLPAAATVK